MNSAQALAIAAASLVFGEWSLEPRLVCFEAELRAVAIEAAASGREAADRAVDAIAAEHSPCAKHDIAGAAALPRICARV